MVPKTKQALPACGYLVSGLQLDPGILKNLQDETASRTYVPIFKDVGGRDDDPLRGQSRVKKSSAAIGELKKALRQVIACLDNAWSPTTFSFMRSQPYGGDQEPHQDYSPKVLATAKKNDEDRVPASMIFALEEGTRLRVFDGCFDVRVDAAARMVEIPVGFCLIFRGDLVHSGVEFDRENHRIHCYLSYPRLKLRPDLVSSVLPPHKTCEHCGFKCLNSDEIRTHRRYCSKNPNVDENQKKRRRTDNTVGEYKCDVCGKVYTKSASFRSHIFRGHKTSSSN